MRTYNYTKRDGLEADAELSLSLKESTDRPLDTPFAQAAREWNDALLIAAAKMWGDNPPFQRKFS